MLRHRNDRFGVVLCGSIAVFALGTWALTGQEPNTGPSEVDASGAVSGDSTPEQLEYRHARLRSAVRSVKLLKEGAASEDWTVSTAAAGEAGKKWTASPVDPELLTRLRTAIQAKNGFAMFRTLEPLLAGGVDGYAKLCDLIHVLESGEETLGKELLAGYWMNFGSMHFAMLHGDALASFAHYYLHAHYTVDRSSFRDKFYAFVPVFLEFYRGRYPEFVEDLKMDLLARLKQSRGHLHYLYPACRAIGFTPQPHVIEPLVHSYQTLNQWTAVFKFLEAQDNFGAVGIFTRFIEKRSKDTRITYEVDLALRSLSRMTPESALKALRFFLDSENLLVKGAAMRAYFHKKRDLNETQRVIDYLQEPDLDIRHARLLMSEMLINNRAIVEAIAKREAELKSPQVQSIVNHALNQSSGQVARWLFRQVRASSEARVDDDSGR